MCAVRLCENRVLRDLLGLEGFGIVGDWKNSTERSFIISTYY
jgi:hypothetical protein